MLWTLAPGHYVYELDSLDGSDATALEVHVVTDPCGTWAWWMDARGRLLTWGRAARC